MVSGTEFPGGDPFLQRQNEPSLAVSTRNSLHLLAGANDYRTVDVPGLPDGKAVGDSWPGVFASVNGGGSWVSTLIPGFPQDNTTEGLNSPLKGYEAGADPVIRAGTNGLLYYSGIVFDRGFGQKSAAFVSRYMDLNNDARNPKAFEDGPIRYIDTRVVDDDPGEVVDPDNSKGFIDKPWLAVDIPRPGSQQVTLQVPQGDDLISQTVDCGPLYMAYAQITGEDTSDVDSKIMFSTSSDCAGSWSEPVELDGEGVSINQGTSVAVNPVNGDVYVTWRQFSRATLKCTRGEDFWENNPAEWPVERVVLGDQLYTKDQAIQILKRNNRGNPWELARGLIVAKLNILSGADDGEIAEMIELSEEKLMDSGWSFDDESSDDNDQNEKKSNNGNGNGNGNSNGKGKGGKSDNNNGNNGGGNNGNNGNSGNNDSGLKWQDLISALDEYNNGP